MDDENPFRAPRSDIGPSVGPESRAGQRTFRDGTLLVARHGAVPPDRCIACNEPASGRRWKKTFHWHPPAYYLLIPFNLLVYVVVAISLRKSAKLDLGICRRHRRQRRWAAVVGWLGTPAGFLGLLILRSGGFSKEHQDAVALACIGVLVFSLVFAFFRRNPVTAKRIDGRRVWLKGVHRDFLEENPGWIAPADSLKSASNRGKQR